MRIMKGLGRMAAAGLLAVLLAACQSTSSSNGTPADTPLNATAPSDPRLAGIAKDLTGVWNGTAGGRAVVLVIESVGKGDGANRLKARGYTSSDRASGQRNPVDIDVAVTDGGYSIAFDGRLGHVEARSISRPGAMEGQVTTGRARVDVTLVKAPA